MYRKIALLFLIFFFMLSCNENSIYYESPVETNIFPNGGFEIGDLYGWIPEGARENSIIVVNDNVFEGSYAAKLTLYPGDFIDNGHRVELNRYYCAEYQTEMVYSWVFKIGKDFKDSDNKYVINQFHDFPDYLIGETWETMKVYPPPVFTCYLRDTVYIYSHSINDGTRIIGKKGISKGYWVRIKYKIKWELTDEGYIETFIDGQPVTAFNGKDYKFYTPTLYNKVGNWFKVGLYNVPTLPDTNSIYVDDVRISFL